MTTTAPSLESTAIHRRLAAFSVLVIALLVIGTGAWIYSERDEQLRIATDGVVSTSRLLAAVMDSHFGGVDKVLTGAAEVLSAYPQAEREGNPAILAFLKRQVAETPITRSILVIGPDGRTRYGTNLAEPYQPVDLSDRAYVRRHAEAKTGSLFIDIPVKSRNDGSWIMVFSRRINGPGDTFSGVVAAVISLKSLAEMVSVAIAAPSDSALLVDEFGTILARSPDHERFVGRSIADLPAFQASRGAVNYVGTTHSPLDGRDRLFASNRSDAYPVIAVVSRDTDVVLADWRLQSTVLAIAAFLIILVILTLVRGVSRQLARVDATMADLATARSVADTANQAKSAFLANMSHELRTPLNAILGFSDALLVGIPGHSCQSRCHDYLGHVQSSGHHLLELINDILDLSKIEVGKAELSLETVDLSQIAREGMMLLKPKADAKGLILSDAALPDGLTLVADPRRLRQIVLNLLSNAVKFTPEGGCVAIAGGRDDDHVVLSVSDTGIGMTNGEIETALTPFGQIISDVARAEAGTGLGLPLSKRLAELHGGALVVTSARGQGTTVTVSLPA
jgi:two-component system cell cycle sensor histidine kinase PleC